MQVTLELPDDLAQELANGGGTDLRRALLEMVALEGYRTGQLTHAEVMRLLEFEHPLEVEAFLKEHGASLDYSLEDLERDRATLRRLTG